MSHNMVAPIDETGTRYGRLLVLDRAENNKHGQARWRCQCDCGVETLVSGLLLRRGATRSCGCLTREPRPDHLKPPRKPVRPIEVRGDIAIVQLTQGFRAILDAADVELVAGRNWCAMTIRRGDGLWVYAASGPILMHRLITGAPAARFVDHADSDGLNNRRSNLRVCTPAENQRNQRTHRTNRLGLKGVWQASNGYRASLKTEGRTYHFGPYPTPEEAHAAYCQAAVEHFGEFARFA